MQEAVSWMMPGSIRLQFVRILIHSQPVHPDELWENFKDALSEDFLRLYGDHTRAYNVAYSFIYIFTCILLLAVAKGAALHFSCHTNTRPSLRSGANAHTRIKSLSRTCMENNYFKTAGGSPSLRAQACTKRVICGKIRKLE